MNMGSVQEIAAMEPTELRGAVRGLVALVEQYGTEEERGNMRALIAGYEAALCCVRETARLLLEGRIK